MDLPYWEVRAPCVPEIRRADASWRDQVNIVGERRVRNRVTRTDVNQLQAAHAEDKSHAQSMENERRYA